MLSGLIIKLALLIFQKKKRKEKKGSSPFNFEIINSKIHFENGFMWHNVAKFTKGISIYIHMTLKPNVLLT